MIANKIDSSKTHLLLKAILFPKNTTAQCWSYIHIYLHSHSVDLEQDTDYYGCIEKISAQFLPTGIKGGTLVKSLFIYIWDKL